LDSNSTSHLQPDGTTFPPVTPDPPAPPGYVMSDSRVLDLDLEPEVDRFTSPDAVGPSAQNARPSPHRQQRSSSVDSHG
jgi:hypothetical protein